MATQEIMDWRETPEETDALSQETAAIIITYWRRSGATFAEIAKRVGVETEVVQMVISELEKNGGYTPTPEEIKAGCEAIQAEWTPQERRERQTVKPVPWRVPETHLEIGGDDD